MFSLDVVELQSPSLAWGQITIDDFSEMFEMNLRYWTPEEYRHQWSIASYRIANGGGRSAFITSMPTPDTSDRLWWWPAWREGERVYVQNQMLLPEQLPEKFDGTDPTKNLDQPSLTGLEGYGISTWETTVTAIRLFADKIAGDVI